MRLRSVNAAVIDTAAITRASGRRAWARPIACAFAIVGALVCLYSVRQADPDFFGYLAYGRLVAESGLTATDPFAYTSNGFHWVAFEYGAQVLLWWTYHAAGPLGLIALKCLVGGLALWSLFLAIRVTSDEPFVWVPIFLLSTSAISRFFVFRPQLFTFAFFALFVAVLFRFLLRRRAPLWILPLVMIAWTNLHGGFVVGLAAVMLAILLQSADSAETHGWRPDAMLKRTGPLWGTLAACAAATFVNPLGVRLWGYVLAELTHGTNRRYITEWRPLSFATDSWSTIVMGLIVLVLAAVAIAQWKSEDDTLRPRAVFWIVSCVPLIAMAYVSVRHVPLAAIWTAPVMTLLAAPLHEQWRHRAATRRAWFFLRGLALLPACLTFTVVYAEPLPVIRTGGKVLGATHPCGAMAFLRDSGFQGNIYNPLWWGGYLTWQLYPHVRVSMDGRNISLYSDAMVVENLKFYTDPTGVADVDTPLRYHTDLLLVPANAPVLSRIAHDPRWHQIFSDRDATIFERAEEIRTARIFRKKFGLSEFSACSGVLE